MYIYVYLYSTFLEFLDNALFSVKYYISLTIVRL